jgi:hypothetical protein
MRRIQRLQSAPALLPRRHVSAVAPRRGWVAARVLFAAALSCVASASACGSDSEPAPAAVVQDAGSCEAGDDGCACIGGSGCRDGLLCIARRCLLIDTEEQPDQTTPPRPSRPFPPAPPVPAVPDAGAASDAGQTPAEPLPDASTVGPEDAGGEPLDAG